MARDDDSLGVKRNFIALALFLLIILVTVDILMRLAPDMLRPHVERPNLTAVGHHHRLPDGSSYYIYTVFESDGDVYQCWWDEKQWNQKKVTNYRAPTLPPGESE